ncbi:MAG: response regulator [Longimicrobiales bacterium]
MRLLVVDDDPSLRTALQMVFEDAGHEVWLAASVAEARAHLERAHVDATLIDAGVSGSGVALWRELEADHRWTGRVLLLTGNLPSLGLLRSHARVIAKPFDYGVLLHYLEELGAAAFYDQGVPTDSLTSTPSA